MSEFLNADCMEVMEKYPDNHFDIAIVDPPYGIGNFVQIGGNVRGDKVNWNDYIPDEKYFKELRRVSKHQIIWGANYYNCFDEIGGAIIWVKNQPMPNFSQAEIASCSFHKKTALYTETWTNYVNTKEGKHPCEKPIALYKWLIKNYCKPGWKILDTHVGSASSLIAFEEFGLEYVGTELDPDYYKAACERLERHRAQGQLFSPEAAWEA